MSLATLLLSVASLAGVVVALTQLIKDATGWAGARVLLVSVLLGMALGGLLAGGGVVELRALDAYPGWASGAVLGILAGFLGSGGKATVTSIQENGAWARATAAQKVEAEASTETSTDPASEWQPASIDDLGRTRTDWPAVPDLDDDAPLIRS